jgi:hypothetical protein
MDMNAESRLPFPAKVVFACYRDKLPELLKFLPNVRKLETKARTDEGPIARLTNVWHGGGEIPAAARAFVSDAMLSWTDNAVWDEGAMTCSWKIDPHAFAEAIECAGVNSFFDEGGKTRIEMRAHVRIDAKKIKGVPGFLAGTVGKTVEEFLRSRIQPNFGEVSQAITRYLESTKTA